MISPVIVTWLFSKILSAMNLNPLSYIDGTSMKYKFFQKDSIPPHKLRALFVDKPASFLTFAALGHSPEQAFSAPDNAARMNRNLKFIYQCNKINLTLYVS